MRLRHAFQASVAAARLRALLLAALASTGAAHADPAAPTPPSAQATLPGRDTVYGRMVPARADAPSIGVVSNPRSRYVLHCAGCHGLDGAGVPGRADVPGLRQLGLWLRVPQGREFVIQVPGVMGSGLGDAQVAEVMNWVFATLAAGPLPADHRPYDAAEVARARAQPLRDVAATRHQLVQQAAQQGLSLY